mmetsp:Transcript_16845/g.47065  ORF Transcript_16845/g.47065 Transcript_16845/m.47065 type:complete len:87 (+) Transcript_16845:1102-1362(+)
MPQNTVHSACSPAPVCHVSSRPRNQAGSQEMMPLDRQQAVPAPLTKAAAPPRVLGVSEKADQCQTRIGPQAALGPERAHSQVLGLS